MLTLYLVISWAIGIALGFHIGQRSLLSWIKYATEQGYRTGVKHTIQQFETIATRLQKEKENTND